jgi:hypothetical protein
MVWRLVLTRSGLGVCVAAGAKVQFLRAQPLEEARERLGSRHAHQLIDNLVGERQQLPRGPALLVTQDPNRNPCPYKVLADEVIE